MDNLLSLLIIAVALAGFFIALHIHRKKCRAEVLVCPLNSNCESVIYSPYSSFLGVPLELLGMTYYALVILGYLSFIIWPGMRSFGFLPLIYWLSIVAFLFSLYLIYVQAVKIREWCVWCLISGMFCTIIFLTTWAL